MPDLLVPPFATTTAVLDVLDPVDRSAPLNRGLLNWHLVLPHSLGGTTWRNLVAPRHAMLIATEPRSATLGWNATRRQGGFGEIRMSGVDGTAASVASSTLYDFLNTTFTVSCWMRTNVAVQANLVARRLIGPAEGNWFFRMDASGTLTARIMDSTAINVIAGRTSVSATLANGQWHHCLVVFTTHTTTVLSNNVTIYVNGRLDQGTQSSAGPTAYSASTQPVTFGALASLAAPLNGALDDVRIYDRGLSAPEVQQLLQASRTGYRRELRWLTPPQVWLVSVGTVRSLTAVLAGSSTTPAAVASLTRRLTASLSTASVSSAVTATLSRRLTSTLTGTSLTPSVDLSSQRRLSATLVGTSTTPAVVPTQRRALTSVLLGSSVTPPVTVQLPGQVALTAQLSGTSTTPALAVPQTTRRLTASLPGVSTTLPSTAPMQRAFTTALVATSSTPAVTAVLTQAVTFIASLQGSSTTPPITATLPRALQVSLSGASSTAPCTVTMQRPLVALLAGVSSTLPTVLLPSTGTVLFTAALGGSSQTSAVTMSMAPTLRIGIVVPQTRTGLVPAPPARVGTVIPD